MIILPSVVLVSPTRVVWLILGVVVVVSNALSFTAVRKFVSSSHWLSIRGSDVNKYNTYNNGTSIPPANNVAEILGVKPLWHAPGWIWKGVWRTHGRLLPLLHRRDSVGLVLDSSQSLKVLWNKAIASVDTTSLVLDDGWTYDLLPSSSRWLLRVIPIRFFPRLHHANIELRTVFLNQALDRILVNSRTTMMMEGVEENDTNPLKIRLICLGAGYDVRATRLTSLGKVNESWELDLPQVIATKTRMLERLKERRQQQQQQQKRRHGHQPYPQTVQLPNLCSVDLNNITALDQVLSSICRNTTATATTTTERWHTIFISEGVLIYLQPGIPEQVLSTCATYGDSLVFADALPQVQGGNETAARQMLNDAGSWHLVEWQPKPGLARHMGRAETVRGTNA